MTGWCTGSARPPRRPSRPAEASPLSWSTELTSVGPRPRARAGRRAASAPGGRAESPRRARRRPGGRGAAEPVRRGSPRTRRAPGPRRRDRVPSGPASSGPVGPGPSCPCTGSRSRPAPSTTPRRRVRPVTGRRPPRCSGSHPRRSPTTPCRACSRRPSTRAAAARALLPRERERATSTARLATARARARRRRGPARWPRPGRSPDSSGRGQRRRGSRVSRPTCDDARRRLDACRHLQAVRNDLVVRAARPQRGRLLAPAPGRGARHAPADAAGRHGGRDRRPARRRRRQLPGVRLRAPPAPRRPRPSTPPTRRPRRRCASGSTTPSSRSTHGRRRPATWRPRPRSRSQAAGSDDLEALHLAVTETTASLGATAAEAAALADLERAAARGRASRPCAWPSSTPPSPSSPAGSPS